MTADRQVTEGRLNPLTVVLGPIAAIRQWLLPIAVAILFGRGAESGFVVVALPLLIVSGVAFQGVVVARTRWSVDASGLALRTGVLNLETRSIPFERIQNVDVVQPFIPRLLGLGEVRVENAGASGTDITLRYLSIRQARELRDMLTAAVAGLPAPTEQPTEQPTDARSVDVLVVTDIRDLLIAGATANRAGALAVAAGVAMQYADDAGFDMAGLFEDAVGTAVTQSTMRLVVGALAIVLVAAVVGWLVSIAESVLRFHGFRLERRGPDLAREYGLLDRTTASFPLARVQSVRIEQPWLRRLLGYATVWADTAGSVGESATGGVVAPILRTRSVWDLAGEILPDGGPGDRTLVPVSRIAIRRAFVPNAVVVTALGGALVFVRPGTAVAVWIAGLFLAWLYATRHHRALGYRLDDDFLHSRAGVFTRREWIVPRSKVQSVSVVSSFFQRRLGVATLRAHTAGTRSGVIRVIDLESDIAGRLADELSRRSAETAFASDGV